MNRVTVALSDLKPNPFKKDICGGRLDPEVVSQIKESATKTSFWEQWVVRKTDAGYEMAFGHHRLQAAIELFGAAHRVGVQLENYSDEQMMIALADENSGDEASTEERVDTVVRAGKGLKDGEFGCKLARSSVEQANRRDRQAATQSESKHEHGSVRCISEFLGRDNWPPTTVQRLLDLEKLDKQALASVADPGETHPNRPGKTKDGKSKKRKISQQTGIELTKLDKGAQRAATEILIDAPVEITTPEVRRAVHSAKARAFSAKIPESKAINEAIKETIRAKQDAKLPDGNGVAQLVESMRGGFDLAQPIWLYEGKILDGRNRYRAAKEAGVEPITKEWVPQKRRRSRFIRFADESASAALEL